MKALLKLSSLATIACISLGCGGKLVSDFGTKLTDGAPCDAIDGGGQQDFVGTWTCNITTTSVMNNPGSTSYPMTFTSQLVFTGNDGGVSVALDSPDSGSTCTALQFNVSGDTATLAGPQDCFEPVYGDITITGGTFVLSGCGVTISGLTADIPPRPGAPADEAAVDTDTGTCTKN